MNRTKKFSNKVVIITGASSGIGRATALAFAREGATTVLAARSHNKLEAVADEIRRSNPRVRVIPTDVSSQEQVKAMVLDTVKEYGAIDILINNAGGGTMGRVENPRFIDDARHLLEVDLFGKIYCAQAVLPIMHRQGSGAIVNLSSVVGRKAFPSFGAYSLSMHAVSAFSDALRQELRGTGIQVTTVHPALTQTALFEHVEQADWPAPFRYMKPQPPETVAGKIVRAVSKHSARVTIPWQARMLLMNEAVSARLGDLMVRLLANPVMMVLLGMYRGQRQELSEAEALIGKK